MFGDHYKKLLRCSFFSAPRTPVRPFTIPERTEYIEIITGGVVFHTVDGEEKSFGKGAIFWHQSGEKTIFKTSPDDPYRCLVCRLETDGMPRQVCRYGQWGSTPDLDSFVEDMLYLNSSGVPDTPAVMIYCLGNLLRQMLPVERQKLPRSLRQACRLIDRDPAAELPVDEIARYARVSKSRLFVLFKEHLDSSPHHYLLTRRIAMAKELLATRCEIPIKQISESCGFQTLEIFYRRFRQYTGTTPAQYRKEHTL